jgi:hypothetical protein
MQSMVCPASRAAARSVSPGAIVGHSITQHAARGGAATTPASPNSTSSTCPASTTATITQSDCAANSAGDAHTVMPRPAASRSRRVSMSRTASAKPRSYSRSAIAKPMLPMPTMPTRIGRPRRWET